MKNGDCTDGWEGLTAKQIARIERIRAERAKQIAKKCACGCKGKSCVSCGAHVQQRDQYLLVERKHIHCLWCYKDKKKRGKRSASMV